MTLPPQLQAASDRVDGMSLRERGFLAATVLAVLWAFWDAVLMQPLGALEQARQAQLASVTGQLADLNRSIQSISTGRGGDMAPRRQLAELRARAVQLDRMLAAATDQLVEPDDMAALLETLLQRSSGLELVAMTTLPAEPVRADDLDTGYFRHGLTVEVRGGYLDLLRYLQALEQMRWRFFWEAVALEVVEHPTSRAVIRVYTLGPREGLIGV